MAKSMVQKGSNQNARLFLSQAPSCYMKLKDDWTGGRKTKTRIES